MKQLNSITKNDVLLKMSELLDKSREDILRANAKDISSFNGGDKAMLDRLKVDSKKVDSMITSLHAVHEQEDPVDKVISDYISPTGLQVTNRTSPFGTIMIIYESRPDVTIEAAVLAFKAGNKILLKGGKEARHSNKVLVDLWHQALTDNGLSTEWITLLEMNRHETRSYLKQPDQKIDLIVPRGGEHLIQFVRENASCAVLVSGRGNNFLYIHTDADWEMTLQVILNAKTHKISACNALDKILINNSIEGFNTKIRDLATILHKHQVEVLVDKAISEALPEEPLIDNSDIWQEEFLALKCCIGVVNSVTEAINMINSFSGGHSSAIMTASAVTAKVFMNSVDAAAVYHNASTRFTDGGQMGVGAELAISTDKLHHRGPLGLKQLVTNKYHVYGNGHIRS